MDIIVGKIAGFCFGVKRAVEGSLKEASKNNEKVYCLGELVHNKEVIKNIENSGIDVITNIEEIKEEKAKLIIRAHGIDKKIYDQANQKNIKIIDFTCPLVSKIHDIAEEYKEKGYYIFLIGSKTHPEIIGTASHCGKNYSIIETVDEIKSEINKLLNTKLNNLLVIVQTTFSTEKFEMIKRIIKEKMDSKVNLVIKNTICHATEQRQIETEELSKQVELMIIIGGKNSSNTRKLHEIAQKHTNSLLIETAKEIDLKKLKNHNKIGCKNCGQVYYRQRLQRNFTKRYRCGKCGGKLEDIK